MIGCGTVRSVLCDRFVEKTCRCSWNVFSKKFGAVYPECGTVNLGEVIQNARRLGYADRGCYIVFSFVYLSNTDHITATFRIATRAPSHRPKTSSLLLKRKNDDEEPRQCLDTSRNETKIHYTWRRYPRKMKRKSPVHIVFEPKSENCLKTDDNLKVKKNPHTITNETRPKLHIAPRKLMYKNSSACLVTYTWSYRPLLHYNPGPHVEAPAGPHLGRIPSALQSRCEPAGDSTLADSRGDSAP